MSGKIKESGKIVLSYLEQYSDFPDLTVSKIIFKENSILFKSVDSIRNIVRYYRGHGGKKQRKILKNKKFKTQLTHNTNPFKSPKSEATELSVFKLPKDRESILFLSDIHLPYHNEAALTTAIQYGIDNKCDTIWLNGDILDMYQASFHEKRPSHKDIKYEFDIAKEFFEELRRCFPKAGIYYKEGNHEMRWMRLLMAKAPEIFGIKEFEIKFLLELEKYKIHWIPNETLVKFGKLNVIHGNEFKGGGGVNPARSLYLKSKSNTIAGDKHKTGENTEGSLDEKITTTWSVGCLCELNPQYLPFAHTIWNHGFAHITMNGDNFHVKNFRIYQGKIL